jgi:hypothetical protein
MLDITQKAMNFKVVKLNRNPVFEMLAIAMYSFLCPNNSKKTIPTIRIKLNDSLE